MKNISRITVLLLALSGCYMSTGASFHTDGTADVPIDPPTDDAAGDTATEESFEDTVDIPLPRCDVPPLERAAEIEYIGEASPRVTGVALYDPARDRVVIYGGLRGSGDYAPEAVAIDMDTHEIRLLHYEGSAPQGWTMAGTAYDPVGDRIFVVGGTVYGSFSNRVLHIRNIGDNALSASNLPELPRYKLRGAAAGYDPSGGRLIIFGGFDGTWTGDGYTDETLEMRPDAPNPEWRLLLEAGGPPAQENAMMTYVPAFGLVLLAKSTSDYQGTRQLFVMRSDAEQWEEIPLDPTWEPGNRPAIFWDNDSCRLITWGGGCTEGAHSIELFSTPATVSEIIIEADNFEPRVFLNATLDPRRRQVVIHGGYDCRVDVFLRGVEMVRFE